MTKQSKRMTQLSKKFDVENYYDLSAAVTMIKEMAVAKFDETIDVAINLGVDPRHADQMVRGTIGLPAGTGKKVRILALTTGENVKKAEDAGADFVGNEDMITKIGGGWLDFDRVVATPEMMPKLSKVARILGPRGLMPNPKLGTVTTDIVKTIAEQKAGQVEYRCEKNGIIHTPIGKKSFTAEQLLENFNALYGALLRNKPVSSKGTYIKTVTISSTMGPGVKILVSSINV